MFQNCMVSTWLLAILGRCFPRVRFWQGTCTRNAAAGTLHFVMCATLVKTISKDKPSVSKNIVIFTFHSINPESTPCAAKYSFSLQTMHSWHLRPRWGSELVVKPFQHHHDVRLRSFPVVLGIAFGGECLWKFSDGTRKHYLDLNCFNSAGSYACIWTIMGGSKTC